jgi:molybdopterin converting factor small subunit
MKVQVYPPISFCDPSVLDDDNCMELSENAVLRDVYKKLKIPFIMRKLLFSTVNHKRSKMDTPLKDGDIISFFSLMAGG